MFAMDGAMVETQIVLMEEVIATARPNLVANPGVNSSPTVVVTMGRTASIEVNVSRRKSSESANPFESMHKRTSVQT